MTRQQVAVEARELLAVETVVRRRLTQLVEGVRHSQDLDPAAKKQTLECLDLTLTEVARTSRSLARLAET